MSDAWGHPDTYPQDSPANPSFTQNPNDECLLLWCAIYAMGHNFDSIVNRQTSNAQANGKTLAALADCITNMPTNPIVVNNPAPPVAAGGGGSSAPCVREPRMFDGSDHLVDSFVREITNSLFLQCRSIVTDRKKCLYLGFYLKDGSPSSWYTSVKKNCPDLLDDYNAFLTAFTEHFEDSNRYVTALAKPC